MTDFVNGLKSLSGNIAITPEASDFLHDAAEHIERLNDALRHANVTLLTMLGIVGDGPTRKIIRQDIERIEAVRTTTDLIAPRHT